MDLYEAIHNRRSHRLYRPEMPPREALERVVDAGLWAPSGMNTQCWDITVLAGKARDELVGLINLSLDETGPHHAANRRGRKEPAAGGGLFQGPGGRPGGHRRDRLADGATPPAPATSKAAPP